MLIITGYQTVFSQLAFAGKKENDPLAKSVPDAKIYLAKQLAKLSAANPGKVGSLRYVTSFSYTKDYGSILFKLNSI